MFFQADALILKSSWWLNTNEDLFKLNLNLNVKRLEPRLNGCKQRTQRKT